MSIGKNHSKNQKRRHLQNNYLKTLLEEFLPETFIKLKYLRISIYLRINILHTYVPLCLNVFQYYETFNEKY